MSKSVQGLIEAFDLEKIEENLYRGGIFDIGTRNVFGGQVLAQALMSAYRTLLDERHCHSLHAYFLRPGNVNLPIVFDVDRIRDGKSFTTRRVVAIQQGKAIFNMSASFQKAEVGFEHQVDMPNVPGPEGLANEQELKGQIIDRIPEEFRGMFTKPRPIEIRPVDPANPFAAEKRKPVKYTWFKASTPLPNDPALHQVAVAYASDFDLMGTSMLPHGVTYMQPGFQGASLDHAMWFHQPMNINDWLLYAMDSPASSEARGLSRGSIYSRDGVLVASTTQEGLIRLHPPENP
ncbi:MAG: acyl-CoA thioesterase II [Pseudomonadales bacterium]|nr:acyl-CoA thioesterase II [Pseudomonadales bacterium]